jgi:flagellum-specific peptidoglycan hydrolase FlgJ
MTPQEFIAAIAPAAQASAARTKIPASFTTAQAALESGWGNSQLAREAFNLFGVKADASWQGSVLELPTKESIGGQWVTQVARWRRYAGWLECLDDHARFLIENPRYRPAFQFQDGSRFASAVAKAGYATDPTYSAKIISIIQGRGLAALDIA